MSKNWSIKEVTGLSEKKKKYKTSLGIKINIYTNTEPSEDKIITQFTLKK